MSFFFPFSAEWQALPRPLAELDELDSPFKPVLVRSISPFGDEEERTALRSLSFNGRDTKSVLLRSYDSRKMIFEGSLSFMGRELNTRFSIESPTLDAENKVFASVISPESGAKDHQLSRSDSLSAKKPCSSLPESANKRHEAALKLQKVYKSFRTRRQLADCAVVVEQRWWKLLDFAELKVSSISFFEIEKPETVVSRWSRARMRAAKVGKGLSKDEKARKLALLHWLEAIDPRHRYGHNLQFYYVKWLQCQSKQPFFYWLDIGEGKEVNLDRCPRSKLHQQCIKYLGPIERKAYEVAVENGKLVYKQSGTLLDTTGGPKEAKWIFVLSTSKILYVGLKNKGTFQHSSFLAGGATLSAGRLVVEDGVLKAVWPHSGHYLPTEENFQEFMSFLREHNVDLTDVKESPTEEEDEAFAKNSNKNVNFRNNQSDANLQEYTEATNVESLAQVNSEARQQDSSSAETSVLNTSKQCHGLHSKITKLEIPTSWDVLDMFKTEKLKTSCHTEPPTSLEDGYESAEDVFLTEEDFIIPKVSFFSDEEEGDEEEPIPKEKIVKRIDSHKEMKSYQLAKQLSSTWTTGVGPRIGCMRDYPSELQFRVLEKANLSPRLTSANSSPLRPSRFSPKV